MKRVLFCLLLLINYVANAQYLPVNDVYNGDVNSANLNFAGKLYGAQNAQDNYGSFLSFGANNWTLQFNGSTEADRDIYIRQNGYGGTIGTWYKLWHSGNLQLPFHQWQNYIGNNVPGNLDNMPGNSSVFAYPSGLGGINTNAPVPGAVVHFSGWADGRYGMQLQSNYGTGELYTRSKNDDAGTWSAWRKILFDENLAITLANSQDVMGRVGALQFNMAGTEVSRIESERVVAMGRCSDLKFLTGTSSELTEKMRISYNGNVGIGNTVPAEKLHVAGNIRAGSGNVGSVQLNQGTSVNSGYINFLRVNGSRIGYIGYDNNNISYNAEDINAAHLFLTNGDEKMRISYSGNVGIGTVTPSEKLSVNGNIRSRKVIVTQSGWPDYVFDSSYQLPSLDSVSAFIQVNKHLPDMPSAATVEKDGHDLGEVQKLLLKKMEEMTLYILKQEEKIKEQGNKIEALEKKLSNTLK